MFRFDYKRWSPRPFCLIVATRSGTGERLPDSPLRLLTSHYSLPYQRMADGAFGRGFFEQLTAAKGDAIMQHSGYIRMSDGIHMAGDQREVQVPSIRYTLKRVMDRGKGIATGALIWLHLP